MKKFETFGDDQNPESAIQKIMQGVPGKPIILTASPTTLNQLVPEGEFGIYNNNLYHTSGGVTLKYTGTPV